MPKPLPADPENMNDDRAAWAEAALNEFRRVTGTDDEDALGDLLCDLMHWCDRTAATSTPPSPAPKCIMRPRPCPNRPTGRTEIMTTTQYTPGPWDASGATIFYATPDEADAMEMIEIRANVTEGGWDTVAFIEAIWRGRPPMPAF